MVKNYFVKRRAQATTKNLYTKHEQALRSTQMSKVAGILVPGVHSGCELWGMHSPRAALAKKARNDLERI